MYIAFGWPAETETGRRESSSDAGCDDSSSVVSLLAVGKVLVVVKGGSIQVWTRGKARVKLGQFEATEEDLRNEGLFRSAAWNSTQKALVVLTEGGRLYVFNLLPGQKDALPAWMASGESSSGKVASTSITVRAQFNLGSIRPATLLVDEKTILLGCSEGELVAINWDGYQKGKLSLLPPARDYDGDPLFNPQCVTRLQYCKSKRMMLIALRNGMCALYTFSSPGLRMKASSSSFCWILAPRSEVITASALSPMSHTLAIGTQCGNVHLYSIHADLSYVKLRTLSLAEWGYTGRASGFVEALKWTEDSKALAVLWDKAGLSVWTSFGCRLMYFSENTRSAEGEAGAGGPPPLPAQRRDSSARSTAFPERSVCWSPEGMQLMANSKGAPSKLLTFSFARASLHSSPTQTKLDQATLLNVPAACLLGDDRILCIYGSDVLGNTEKPVLHHLMLPQTYISSNWPAKNLAVTKDCNDIAVSGERGVILYNTKQKRWRMFGDINQENEIKCHSLTWVQDMIMLCVTLCKKGASYLEDDSEHIQNSAQLRFYPKYHLDATSLVASKRLNAIPRAINSQEDCVIVLSGEVGKLDALVLCVKVEGALDPSQRPKKGKIEVLKEVCIVTMRTVPILVSCVPSHTGSPIGLGPGGPKACIVLHVDGQLCHLDLETGSEKGILDKTEHFWADSMESLSGGLLWTYGARGINILDMGRVLQLVRENKMARVEIQETDPELEFDKEVYPLGLHPKINSIVGIAQHSSNIPNTSSHGFSPLPKTQPVLSPLVRYLLNHGAREEARKLVKRSIGHPHFSHSLEWLVFTVLEKEYSMSDKERSIRAANTKSFYTLGGVIDLVKDLAIFVDVIVRVARKIDPVHWKLLFSQTGQPTALFEKALQLRSYNTAAGFLVIVETIEGPDLGQECALNLLQETLQEGEYDLTGELVRFLVRSARDMLSNAQREKETGATWFGQIFGGFSSLSSPSERERLLKAAVHKYLSAHAAALIASRRLQDLATFIHKSGFDIVPLLREEKNGVAQLTSFKQAIKEIEAAFVATGNSTRLISLADSELLLEAFRAAGLTEWVIVLATILRRSPLLLNMFRDDRALWSVFIKNLQEDANYADLLKELEAGMVLG